MTAAAPAPTEVGATDTPFATVQVSAWAAAIEAGVLAAAAREDPEVPWRGDATEDELRALEEAGRRAQQDFVAANLGLVGAVLGPYVRGGAPAADLFQEGCLGLIAAVERFDHRRGVRFATYATYWVRTHVASATSRSAPGVTVPVSRNDQLRVAHGVESALAQELGRVPTVAEVAAAIGRDERWTAGLLGQRGVRSLDELDDRALHRLADQAGQRDEASQREPEAWARRLMATLIGFDRQVLERRLGFGGRSPSSLASVARELGVPVGRVRRAEVRALEQLRGRCPRAMAGTAP
ncbi:MAG: sigma-70 family RNA polymerase sigma factor [Janthinobacterium lividum]